MLTAVILLLLLLLLLVLLLLLFLLYMSNVGWPLFSSPVCLLFFYTYCSIPYTPLLFFRF